MAVRISSRYDEGRTVITVLGILKARHVGELERVCAAADSPLVVDLTGLLFADAAGSEMLRRLVDAGAEVLNASPYVRILLEDAERSWNLDPRR